MKRIFVTALLAMSVACISRATDIQIFPTGPVFKLQPAPTWGISGPTGFNNNFFFVPLSQNESVCVFVKNNNTTNPHTFSASIVVNSDPANTTPSDGTWQAGASSSGLVAATSPGQPAGIGVSVSGAAGVSVNFSASSTVGGSPETANIVIVQTTGNCFSGNQFKGSAPQTLAAVPIIQAISEGLSQAFASAAISATNPASGLLLLNVNANSGPRSIYYNSLTITCSALCQVSVATSTGNGTGCTVGSSVNENIGSSTITGASVLIGACTTNPTLVAGNNIFNGLNIAAGSSVTLDLRGFLAPSGGPFGISVVATTFTGVITGQLTWYEK